jgi:hypothetical protein
MVLPRHSFCFAGSVPLQLLIADSSTLQEWSWWSMVDIDWGTFVPRISNFQVIELQQGGMFCAASFLHSGHKAPVSYLHDPTSR